MIDTNALLSISFALISNFSRVVDVPPDGVPRDRSDLVKYVIGTPLLPDSVYLVHRKGTEFWLDWGTVEGYRAPGSYFQLQAPRRIPKFVGTTSLSSNDVFEIAARALRQLVKHGNPLTNGVPWVKRRLRTMASASPCSGSTGPTQTVAPMRRPMLRSMVGAGV